MIERNTQVQHPLIILLYVMGTVGIGMVLIGPVIGAVLASLIFPDLNLMEELKGALESGVIGPALRQSLLLMQGIATTVAFIAGPLLLYKAIGKSFGSNLSFSKNELIPILLTPIIVLVSFAFISYTMELNQGLTLPESLKHIEEWARKSEDRMKMQTEAITQMNNLGELCVALLVIAILPGIGEELVFRGMIQKLFIESKTNPHMAIWLAAIIFSAIHFQFFGFLPRVLLGALFGYLFYWSGNLLIPIIAHLFTNGAQVILIYIYEKDQFGYDLETASTISTTTILISLLLSSMFLYYFKRFYQNNKAPLDTSRIE